MSTNLLRPRWIAPSIHLLLFGVTLWIAMTHQSQPLFDGPAAFGFNVLLFADLPISIVAFSMMWDRHFTTAIALWGIFGTVQWYLWGLVIERIISKRQRGDDITA